MNQLTIRPYSLKAGPYWKSPIAISVTSPGGAFNMGGVRLFESRLTGREWFGVHIHLEDHPRK